MDSSTVFGIDIDGILADTDLAIRIYLKKLFNYDLKREEVVSYHYEDFLNLEPAEIDRLWTVMDKEGVFAGLSSGAAIYQAIVFAHEMDEGNIVVILPDGGWKYLSEHYWDKS